MTGRSTSKKMTNLPLEEQSHCEHANEPVKMRVLEKRGEKTILFCLWKSLQSIENMDKLNGTKRFKANIKAIEKSDNP